MPSKRTQLPLLEVSLLDNEERAALLCYFLSLALYFPL